MKFKTILFLLLLSTSVKSQIYDADIDAYSFSIKNNGESIEFLKTGKDIQSPKPTIIFCQGSLPIPLIIKFEDGERIITAINNFDYRELSKNYNFVVVSMPFTPLIVEEKDLNNQSAYVTNVEKSHSYLPEYLDANYLDKYIKRGNDVIKFLLTQKWVDPKQIFIVGHSQGAKVATKIASTNKNVAALGFLSSNPLGRVDQYIREYRMLETKGMLSKEEAQEKINKTYEWWSWLNQNKDIPSENGEDSPRTTISFSEPVLNDLINLQIPIFIGFGTSDITSSYCDILPIDLIREGKKNYQFKPYLGLDHNFFEIGENGKPIYEKAHWKDVMSDLVIWLDTVKN